MEKKLTGSLEIFGDLISKIKYNFDFKQPHNRPAPTNVLDEFKLIKQSKREQFDKIMEEPEMKELVKESNAQIDYSMRGFNTLPPQILSRKITLSMSEEFFTTWVEKAIDDLIKEKPLHKETINTFYKENFDVDNKYT